MTGDALTGTWDVSVATPIGTVGTTYVFTDDAGTVTGTATSSHETVPLTDVTLEPGPDGLRVTWSQTVRRPLRLDLRFDVVVAGHSMTGYSRAGRLPRSRVTGTRSPRPDGGG